MEKKEREFGTVDSPAVPGRGEVSQVMHRARKTAMNRRPWFQVGELVPSSGRSGKEHWGSFVPQRKNEVKKGRIWDRYEKSSLNRCPGEKMWFGSICFFSPSDFGQSQGNQLPARVSSPILVISHAAGRNHGLEESHSSLPWSPRWISW